MFLFQQVCKIFTKIRSFLIFNQNFPLSHRKEREEKVCLNCQTELTGRFCPSCGQENLEPKESVWGLVSHFFNDITHFDGKFFTSLKYLIRKPGFLPAEYMRGRRASYLNPIRMYVFTSAVFFLTFYSLYSPTKFLEGGNMLPDLNKKTLTSFQEKAYEQAETREDSLAVDSSFALLKKLSGLKPDTTKKKKDTAGVKSSVGGVKFSKLETDDNYTTRAQYDSAQKVLPESERDSWFERLLRYKNFDIEERYGSNEQLMWREVGTHFVHMFPYMLFVSLPLYALFLKLLYIRRKKYFYVDHAMFLIYLYIFTFLFLLVYFAIDKLNDKLDSGIIKVLAAGYFIYGVYYAYRSMRNFYEQGFFKTFIKFIVLNFLALITLALLFTVFFGITFLQV